MTFSSSVFLPIHPRPGRSPNGFSSTGAESTKAEFARADQDGTLVRHALYATWRATETTDTAESLTWLRAELPNYHERGRESVAIVLRYLATMETAHWKEDANADKLVAGAVENGHV